MARTIPERLTLVDDTNPDNVCTLVVDDDLGNLIVSATCGPERITIQLHEMQARRLRGRIDKFFREN